MTLKYNFTVVNPQTKEESNLVGTFSSQESEILKDFVKYADEVIQTAFIENHNYGSFQIKQAYPNEPLNISCNIPDWNEVMLFIYKLRPLILKNERTNYHKVSSMLGKKLNHLSIRGFLKLQKDFFTGKNYQSKIVIKSNDAILNSEEVLFEYLNAFEYHREKDKQKFIEELHHILPLDVSKVIFIGLLLDKCKAIAYLANFIDLLTGKISKLNIEAKLQNL